MRKDPMLKFEVARSMKVHSQSSNNVETFLDSGNLPQRLWYRSSKVLAWCTVTPRQLAVSLVLLQVTGY